MLNLIPYAQRHNNASVYNPFQMFDDLEKHFFGSNDIAEFKTDIRDEGDHYLMEADLPGFQKEDIHIDLSDNTLTIHAERHSTMRSRTRRATTSAAERSYGSYARSFGMDGINTDAISASYTDGVLKLTLPKAAPVTGQSRRLEIQ